MLFRTFAVHITVGIAMLKRMQTHEVVQPPLFSTGMNKGPHSRTAIALVVASIVLGFAFPAWSDSALILFFLACAIGLLGEVLCVVRLGEVRVRMSKSAQFLVIRRDITPTRYYFYVVAYTVLGGFSLVVANVGLWRVVAHHVA